MIYQTLSSQASCLCRCVGQTLGRCSCGQEARLHCLSGIRHLSIGIIAFSLVIATFVPHAGAQTALADGQVVSVPELSITGFTVVADESQPFTAFDFSFSGILYSTVLSRSDLTGLVFGYTVYVSNISDGFAVLDELRIPGWSGIATSVWQDDSFFNPKTESADRLEPGVIRWSFPRPPNPSIGLDSFSRTMFVLTNYDQFTFVDATLKIHPNPNNTFAIAPAYAPIPEPKTIVGLCLGLAVLISCRFRRGNARWLGRDSC